MTSNLDFIFTSISYVFQFYFDFVFQCYFDFGFDYLEIGFQCRFEFEFQLYFNFGPLLFSDGCMP